MSQVCNHHYSTPGTSCPHTMMKPSNNTSDVLHEMWNMLVDIRNRLDRIEFRSGRNASLVATFGISSNRTDVEGHGAIISGGVNGCKHYLLSAAHVLIPVVNDLINNNTNDNNKRHQTLYLRPKNGSQFVSVHIGTCLYIPDTYVQSGNNDVSLLELDSEDIYGNANLSVLDGATIANPEQIGEKVVAIGRSFLHGDITASEDTDDFSKFTVHGHSKPGNSGAPVFTADKVLVGVVHGSSKHRGKHGLYAFDDASIVYCHSVEKALSSENGMRKVRIDQPSETVQYLTWAEDVPVDVSQGTVDLKSYLEANENGDLSKLNRELRSRDNGSDEVLQDIMNNLLAYCQRNNENTTSIRLDTAQIWKWNNVDKEN